MGPMKASGIDAALAAAAGESGADGEAVVAQAGALESPATQYPAPRRSGYARLPEVWSGRDDE